MSLDISHVSEGITREHWSKLSFGMVNYVERRAEVFLFAYVSEASKDAGDKSTLAERFEFSGKDFDDIFDEENTNPLNENARKLAYQKIKTLKTSEHGVDWSTAADNV